MRQTDVQLFPKLTANPLDWPTGIVSNIVSRFFSFFFFVCYILLFCFGLKYFLLLLVLSLRFFVGNYRLWLGLSGAPSRSVHANWVRKTCKPAWIKYWIIRLNDMLTSRQSDIYRDKEESNRPGIGTDGRPRTGSGRPKISFHASYF